MQITTKQRVTVKQIWTVKGETQRSQGEERKNCISERESLRLSIL